jgi:8-oxo-dGTP pyrophosphatase MutT (NUDIX family)
MAPRPRTGWKQDFLPANCRNAAALVLLYPKNDTAHILLTVRTDDLPTHRGQVSFPGGGLESNETTVEAALREGWEEVGIRPSQVDILGLLSPLHIPVSGFILHPVVAVSTERPLFRPQEGEVARTLEVAISDLCAAERVQEETRVFAGQSYQVPYFLVDDSKVWGATAMVLAEFLCLLGCPPTSPNVRP